MPPDVYWTQERIIAALRAEYERTGKVPAAGDWAYSTPERPQQRSVFDRFGSWNVAIVAAGLMPRPAKRLGARYVR